MVEAVEVIRELIDIRTDPVRCTVFVSAFHHRSEARDVLHQTLLRLALRLCNCKLGKVPAACGLVLRKNRLDSNDCVQNVRAGVSLEGGEFLRIKDIVLGCLVRQIAVLDGSECNLLCGILRFLSGDFRIALNLLLHLLIDIRDERLQTHHATVSCFEGLSVLTVDGTKADVPKLCLFIAKTAFSCSAEHLHKVKCLPLVCNINNFIRMIFIAAVLNRCKIRCRIQRRAVTL